MKSPFTDFKTRFTAKVGDQYIHESLTGITTPNKKWAWKPDRNELRLAKARHEFLKDAKILPIIEVKLQTGAMQ